MANDSEEKSWYCVRSKTKRERLTADLLRKILGMEVFCPRLRFKRNTSRGMVWFEEAMFPGYFFVRFNFIEEFKKVRYASGVTGIVHFGSKYARIPDVALACIRDSMEEGELHTVREDISEGDEVLITDGPFKGLMALVTRKMPGRERVRLLFDFLGNQAKVEISEEAVILTNNGVDQ